MKAYGGREIMNNFEEKITAHIGKDGLFGDTIDVLQVNVGLKCNQNCLHCHLDCSPKRPEMMGWPIMKMILGAVEASRCRLVDITGGAPELNPLFKRFVNALAEKGCPVQVRTNLTVLEEPGLEDLPYFLKEHRVRLVASLPCYTTENVCAQRGQGVFEKSIEALKRLNALGYGNEDSLTLNLVYNPGGAFLPSPQLSLEEDYRRELFEQFRIAFTHLLTITNVPLGRFRKELIRNSQLAPYMELLRESFNPSTIRGLMCRHQVSVGWDGKLYDCDFSLAIGLPVNHGAPDHIQSFSPHELQNRRIMTGEHCFACTAGSGSS
jgi:radical SAM/Cys-rich protein